MITVRYVVFPGSEKLDMGPKRPACLCESEQQAQWMAKVRAPHGYYEPIEPPIMLAVTGDE